MTGALVDLPAGPPDIGLSLALVLLALGWFAGSFPSSIVVGRRAGVDVVRDGERNPGAANVWRLAGPRAGLVAFGLDVAKVALPALVGYGVGGWWGAWVGSIGAVLGSMRPLPPRLRGGRGVAAGAAACIVLQPVAAGLSIGALAVAWIARRSRVLAIAVAFATYPVAVAALSVRTLATAWPLAGIGTLYLLLLARFALTAPGRRGGVPHAGTGGVAERRRRD